MSKVFIQSTNIISPLGFSSEENFDRTLKGETGVKKVTDQSLSQQAFFGAVMDWKRIDDSFPALKAFGKMEKLLIASVEKCIKANPEKFNPEKNLLILSTTKGEIDALRGNDDPPQQAFLHHTAKMVAEYFSLKRQPIVVSNACISGVLALNMAARLIANDMEDEVIVTGGDLVTDFVVSGFNSLMAIGSSLCKPFDAERDGINLGEGAATVWLGKKPSEIEVLPGFTSNDANHISGPSRTGDGLLSAVSKTLQASGKFPENIDFISAHGTATLFNDDMESKAFKQAKLDETPLNSMKGYFGHTLGAAGVIESIMCLESMKRQLILKNLGCEVPGTAEKLNIALENHPAKLKTVLKTASGFGGCNAAIIFEKHG